MIMSFFDRNVRLGLVRIGSVVQGVTFEPKKQPFDRFGHIVGFSRNCSNELIVNVLWDDGKTYETHPVNLIWIGE